MTIRISSLFNALLVTTSCILGGEIATAHATSTPNQEIPSSLIEQGHYQAVLGDCMACHSAPGRPTYSGGFPFPLPIGTIYSTNITPDPEHGIGTYSEADFARAVRQGIRKDGSTLYPAMPFPSYARLSDADIHALYVYFHNGVKPQAIAPPENKIMWPLSMRWPLIIWRWLFAPNVQKAQQRTAAEFSDPVLARGAYLVEGAGHCGACHTPRGITMAEKAQTAQDGNAFLAGGSVVEGWFIPSLRQENRTGLGRWSEQDIVDFLKTGRAPTGASFGGMTPVVEHSTHGYSDSDLHAIARFLHQLTPADPHEQPWQYSPQTASALQHADLSARGAQVYIDRCAACHRTDGHGYGTVFPPLAGNPVVMTADPSSVVHIVQSGATIQPLPTSVSAFTMPSFGKTLSDREIADVVSFIRQAWGNQAAPVSEQKVKQLRETMPESTPPSKLPKN
ncbi:c-type cytochrome [Saccharibacter sp. 17.LH.SD]|uniref:c-type cytochrome n=1 Tax=Saccharibacter sp. 17.LH.SD TaxID=2689393 RepID=UPI001369A0C3|nr:cytochrome c [Saccharibacter sp. 17.LH.SD]MXV45262.1 c-type cytochrome [Saccharibacter sp. 17.LH.SD]